MVTLLLHTSRMILLSCVWIKLFYIRNPLTFGALTSQALWEERPSPGRWVHTRVEASVAATRPLKSPNQALLKFSFELAQAQL
jgi:hypothetical protein